MEYRLKETGYELREHEVRYLEEKVGDVERMLGDDVDATRLEVEVMKDPHHWKGPKVFRVEFNLHHHGTLYRAEGFGETPQAAIDEAKDELTRQLVGAHERRTSLVRRGARRFKELLRRWRAE